MKTDQNYLSPPDGFWVNQLLSSTKAVEAPYPKHVAATSRQPLAPGMEEILLRKLDEITSSMQGVASAAFSEIIERDLRKVDENIAKFQHSCLEYADRLYKRLRFLREISRDEFPQEDYISPTSLKGLLKFLTGPLLFLYPEVSLSTDGRVCAEWRSNDNQPCDSVSKSSESNTCCKALFSDEALRGWAKAAHCSVPLKATRSFIGKLGRILQWTQ